MPAVVQIIIPGVPKAWERSRHRGGRHFDSPAMKKWKTDTAWLMKAACPRPLDGPLDVTVIAVWPCPKAERARHGHTRRVRPMRPDADNIAKTLDAGNGILFRDDEQIVRLVVEKYVGRADEQPHTEIQILALGVGEEAA